MGRRIEGDYDTSTYMFMLALHLKPCSSGCENMLLQRYTSGSLASCSGTSSQSRAACGRATRLTQAQCLLGLAPYISEILT